jgi:cold shock CspA family protein
MYGRVKLFREEDSYGFISLKNPIGNLTEVFVHITAVKNAKKLERGWIVEFKLDLNRKDPDKVIATNVRIVDDSPRTEISYNTAKTLIDVLNNLDDLSRDEELARADLNNSLTVTLPRSYEVLKNDFVTDDDVDDEDDYKGNQA